MENSTATTAASSTDSNLETQIEEAEAERLRAQGREALLVQQAGRFRAEALTEKSRADHYEAKFKAEALGHSLTMGRAGRLAAHNSDLAARVVSLTGDLSDAKSALHRATRADRVASRVAASIPSPSYREARAAIEAASRKRDADREVALAVVGGGIALGLVLVGIAAMSSSDE